MLDFTAQHVGVYRYAQETTWSNPLPIINLHISDMIWRQVTGSQHIDRNPPPFLSIHGAGFESSYAYGHERENWVAQIATDDIQNSDDPSQTLIRSGADWVSVPNRVYLNNKMRSHWQQHFQELLHASRDASPRAQLFVSSGLASMLSVFIQAAQEQIQPTPVEQFKQLIDQDTAFIANLSDLSEQCGYSADHMRILFHQTFGMTPVAYRTRRRLAMASELIANSRKSIQAISEELGFQHSSHFCTAYKKHYGVSPGKDLKRLRI